MKASPLSNETDRRIDPYSDCEELTETVKRAGLGEDQNQFCIQVSSELNFRTSPRWKDRSAKVRLGNCSFVFPHPIDILIAKLNRLEDKDLRAFEVVLAKTGH